MALDMKHATLDDLRSASLDDLRAASSIAKRQRVVQHFGAAQTRSRMAEARLKEAGDLAWHEKELRKTPDPDHILQEAETRAAEIRERADTAEHAALQALAFSEARLDAAESAEAAQVKAESESSVELERVAGESIEARRSRLDAAARDMEKRAEILRVCHQQRDADAATLRGCQESKAADISKADRILQEAKEKAESVRPERERLIAKIDEIKRFEEAERAARNEELAARREYDASR